MSSPRIVVCGAGAIGASVAWFLARRGAAPLVVDRARPGAAASGKAAGFLAEDWSAGTPLDGLMRASFALHAEIAEELGAERIGYRPMDAMMTAAADEGSVEPYRRLESPAWLDGNVAVHEVIGDTATTAQVNPYAFTTALVEDAVARGATARTGVVEGIDLDPDTGAVTGVVIDGATEPADVVVLALGPWTSQAQRWLALPQVFGSRGRVGGAGGGRAEPGGVQRVRGARRPAGAARDLPPSGRRGVRQRALGARRPARRPGRDRPHRRRPATSCTGGRASTRARCATRRSSPAGPATAR